MANPYTWTQPVTTRSSGSERMTYEDMNRITVNLAWLYAQCGEIQITVPGSIISKTSWIRNDIITVAEWAEILSCLTNICTALQYAKPTEPDNTMIYTNINNVEDIELNCYNIIAAYENIPNMNHYVGDKIGTAYRYAGDGFNSGGRYDE